MKKKIFFILIVIIILINVGTFAIINLDKVKKYYDPEYDSNLIKNINYFDINNDEIKNKYQFVYISDSHISVIDNSEPDERIRTSLVDRQNVFNYDKPKSEDIFKEIVKYTNNKNADALLLGGDIIDSPSNSNLNFIEKNLKNLNKEYLYTFGNHDWTFAWDYQTQETEKKYTPKFKNMMEDTDVSYLEYQDLIVLAINNSKNKIEEKNISKIKEVLEKKKPTIVMMHVPMATDYLVEQNKKLRERISVIGDGGIQITDSTKKAFDLILSDQYKVFYIISGHVHVKMEDNINEKIFEIVSAPAYDGNINLLKINN